MAIKGLEGRGWIGKYLSTSEVNLLKTRYAFRKKKSIVCNPCVFKLIRYLFSWTTLAVKKFMTSYKSQNANEDIFNFRNEREPCVVFNSF